MKLTTIISLPLLLAVTVGAITPAYTAMIVPDRNLTPAQAERPLLVAYHHRAHWGHWAFRGYERYVPRHHFFPYARLAPGPYAYAARRPYVYAPPGYYYISNISSGLVAEVMNHNTYSNAQVALWRNYQGEADNSSEQWSIVPQNSEQFPTPDEDQWFLLQNRHSGLCLYTYGYQNDAPVVQHTCGGEPQMQWRWRRRGSHVVLENIYALNVGQQRCLDASNSLAPTPPIEGAALVAHPCIANGHAWNTVNQQWELIPVN